MRQAVTWCVAALAALSVAVASPSAGSSAAVLAEGSIVTVAGTGSDGATGDGGSATAAAINHPRGIAVLADGSFVFAQPFIPMVRRVSPDGAISTPVGTGERGYVGDGGPATRARLDLVHGVAALPDGSFVVDDMGNNRIRRVWPDGTITTVVGTGDNGFSGDGGPAAAAAIALPRGVAARPNGELLIADTGNARVRSVSPTGVINSVAGTGEAGFSGDGGPATAARLRRPFAVAPLPGGGLLIADLDNNRIRRVAADGTISTVAGTGEARFSGDGGLAVAASLNLPHAVATLPDGGFLIADTYNHRVRRVYPDGTITTVAGTGTAGYSGDGGPAIAAELNLPKALAVLPDGSGFLVGDAANNRVRLVRINLRPALKLRVTNPRMQSKAGRSATMRYTLSDAGTAQLDVLRRGRVVLRTTARAARGLNRLVFGAKLRPDSYGLRLVATTPDGRSARATASLRVVR